ncbi:MAG: HD domain-containing protein [Moorea sp. SIO1G6]|uniref:HD domain-containing protein n=1 Tax=Moorena sp. SIO1G6 TaxID=2607840 RepID=UPI0013C298D5|nr:HD domain-containing protein [Moorena sp. SIO1G6]NEP52237.1 HD domain-containing protein [Moorena sp. SIO3C2]NET63719.1 HD domain-containing protein [Moorena sp. SIO1G6]
MDLLTKDQWDFSSQCLEELVNGVTDQIVKALLDLRGGRMGAQVDRLEHSLQTATRALRSGADEEMVVCALLHDIGDNLAPYNHGQVAAAILRPYVSPENAWMIENHEIFQGYYFRDFMGLDRNERDKFKGHPAFEQTIIFCDDWDQLSFDPNYDTMPLSYFRPILESIFSREPRL